MGLKVFQIILDLPNSVAFGGQVLSGKVIVHLDAEKKMRNLRVQLQGRAKTGWSENQGVHFGPGHHMAAGVGPGPGHHMGHHNIGAGGHIRSHHAQHRTVHYSAEEEYFNWNIFLVGQNDGQTTVLPAGQHEFPFSVTLPVGCPSSFEGDYGSIRYLAKAVIDRPWKFDHESKVMFTVLEHQDLNLDPRARQPIQRTESKTMGSWFWKSGELSATATMPQMGFVPGQQLGLKLHVKCTSSKRDIDSVSCYIRQVVNYTGHHGWSTHCRQERERYAGLQHSQPISGGSEVRHSDGIRTRATARAEASREVHLVQTRHRFCVVLHPSSRQLHGTSWVVHALSTGKRTIRWATTLSTHLWRERGKTFRWDSYPGNSSG